jgi:hypothetical protein
MLPLNVNKCKTFTRSFHPIIASYVLNGKILERVCSMIDLGVILDSKLSFREHIDSVVNKGSAMFGFIRRLSREFRDPYTLKVLYVTYVRSKLEYANCVWHSFLNLLFIFARPFVRLYVCTDVCNQLVKINQSRT